MSFKRFIEHVGENLSKNARHAAEDASALTKIREGALHDVESIVRGVKPADIAKKEASIRADMNTIFLRENVPAEQRRRIMDAVLDAAKNPKPEAPPVPSNRTTAAATDPRAQSSSIINPATGKPFEAAERRAGGAAQPAQAPAPQAAQAPTARAQAQAPAPQGRSDGLTGNNAVDSDIMGGRAIREQNTIDIAKYWSTRAGDLNKIALQFGNAKNDPLTSAKMLKELEEKYPNVINPSAKYTGPDPVDVNAVIAKIRQDEKVMKDGKIDGVVGISQREFEALRKSIYDPLVEKMASELKTSRWSNAYSADDFALFERAIHETGRYGGAARPGGNMPAAKAIEQLRTPGGKIYADELSNIKAVSPKGGLTDAQIAQAGDAKFGHRVLDGVLAIPRGIKDFFYKPARWEGGASRSMAGRVGAGLLAIGAVVGQPFVDIVPDGKEYKGINAVEYHFGMMRGWMSKDYQDNIINKFNTGKASAMEADMAKQFLAKKNEAQEVANEGAVKARENTQKKIGQDYASTIQSAAERDAQEYAARRNGVAAPAAPAGTGERGIPLVEADAAVGELLTKYGVVDTQQMVKLAEDVANKAKGGSSATLSAAEYDEVKKGAAYQALSKDAKQHLDQALGPKFAP